MVWWEALNPFASPSTLDLTTVVLWGLGITVGLMAVALGITFLWQRFKDGRKSELKQGKA